MKIKVFAAIAIFPLALTLGVILQKRYVRLLAQPVSLCTVTQYHSLYRKLRGDDYVIVRGFLYGGNVLYLADAKINACGESVVGIELPEDDKAFSSKEIQDMFGELRRAREPEKVARAEVVLVGTLVENERSCFASRYVIRALAVSKPISSIEILDASALESQLKEAR